jgi:hypothetical protein
MKANVYIREPDYLQIWGNCGRMSYLEMSWCQPSNQEIGVQVFIAKNIGFRNLATAWITENVERFSVVNRAIDPLYADGRFNPSGTEAPPLSGSG